MDTAYLVVMILLVLVLVLSAVGKLRREPKIVKVVHEVVGVPLRYFPVLADLELAGAAGLLLGRAWAFLGTAAAIGLVLYFLGAVVAHARVRDVKGIAGPFVPLVFSCAALALQLASASTA